MATATSRAVSSLTDVVAVRFEAPGMVNVVTWKSVHVVDVRNGRCDCEDMKYRLDGDGRCKHIWRALIEADQLPLGPLTGIEADLDEREALPDFEDYLPEVSYA